MPYSSIDDLPEDVQDALPEHGQEIYKEAYNSASDQYDEESTAHQVAWSAVKEVFHKNEDGDWAKDEDE